MSNFREKLLKVLKKDKRLFVDGELNENKLKDFSDNYDEKFIEILLDNDFTRETFFIKIKDVYVFKINAFKFFLDENKINNSYTQFENKIGLFSDNKLIKNRGEVVLNWPYKDCVLEGGQSNEDGTDTFFEYDEKKGDFEEKTEKRKEIFFNEILAKDEIDRLEDEKLFVNLKRIDKNGENILESFKRDAEINKKRGLSEDTITDNLLIKGNNLLALHSLKKEFAGKVKLIYIDPPYNTGNDSFKYNDRFNHSTWLTFMKNRLEVAKELLKDDGVIFVQCDDNEQAYLKILMDEIFGRENFVNNIVVKMSPEGGMKTTHKHRGIIKVKEYVITYSNNKNITKFHPQYIEKYEYNKEYEWIVSNKNDLPKNWKIEKLYNYINKNYGLNIKSDLSNLDLSDNKIKKILIELSGSIWYRTRLQKGKAEELKDRFNEVVEYQEGQYAYKGRRISFLDKTLQYIWKDGKKIKTFVTLLGDLYIDISIFKIFNQGGVTFNNGKKPEDLIGRLISLVTNEGDIVLDYHLGSGTTGAVSHKLKRQYIGVEQMDYIDDLAVTRLKNVINGNDNGGITKQIGWKGGGDFVYMELAKWNEEAKEKIEKSKNLKDLEKFFDKMYEKYFLNYNVKIKDFKEKVLVDDKFKKLSLERQKEIFLKMLDLNQMYVNFSERNDKKYGIKKEDIKLSEDFYQKK